MKILWLLLAVLTVVPVEAQSVSLTWTAPAECTTSAPCTYILNRADLASGTASCPGTGYNALNPSSPVSGTSYVDPSPTALVCYTVQTAQYNIASSPSNSGVPIQVSTPPSTITSVTVACNPASISLSQTSTCTATVTGTGSFNPAVTWSSSSGDSISSTGIFVPSSTATVTATSVQDTTKNGSASISLTGSTPPPPVAATPTFSPVGGTYSAAQSVAISSTTSGASIYYTNDGSIPTTSSTPYTSPVIVGASMTLNAIATATGFTNSQVGTATYTISVAPTNPVFVKITTATTTKPSYTCTPGDFLFLGANNNGVGTANAFLSISSSTDTFTQLGKNVGGVWHSQMSAWTGVCGGTGTRTVTFTASILGQIGVVVAEFKGPSTALSNAGNEQYYTGSYPVSGTNPQGTTLDIFISGNPNGFTTSSCAPAIHAGGVSAVADLWYAITPVGSNYSCSFTSSSNAAYVGTIFGAFR